MLTIQIRFYEELNDFLPACKKKISYELQLNNNTSVKDVIESQKVPHTEVDLILVNSEPVDFNYKVNQNDRISVYPMFESFDISGIKPEGQAPLRETKFILDVHLETLARDLRLLGFDTLYSNSFDDHEIAEISKNENRIVLTMDMDLLKHKKINRGLWIRSQNPKRQLIEVVRRFDLKKNIQPFKRCTKCNGLIKNIEKDKIKNLLEPKTYKYYKTFYQCSQCKQIYRKGSLVTKLSEMIKLFNSDEKENTTTPPS